MFQSHPQTEQISKMGYHPHPHPPPTHVPLPHQQNMNVVGPTEGAEAVQDPPYYPSYFTQLQATGNAAGTGLVLALNPAHNQFLSSQQSHQPDRPWWLWSTAVIDIVLAVFFAGRLAYKMMVAEQIVVVGDPSMMMWALFVIFISLTIHFAMGLGLLAGLNSPEHSSALWYCQAWSYGAYFHFAELTLIFFGLLLSPQRKNENVAVQFLYFAGRLAFRIGSFIIVRRFMYDIAMKEQEREAAERRFLQQCMLSQPQQHEPLQMAMGMGIPHQDSPPS